MSDSILDLSTLRGSTLTQKRGELQVSPMERESSVVVSESTALIQVIERAARDKSVDIDKLERLIALQQKIFERNAESAYNAAMAACQAEMPRIVPKSQNDQTGSFYAALEEIDRVARPVYTGHGFGLSFGTADCPIKDHYRQTCKVLHREGHSETHIADIPMDLVGIKGNPNKTGVQGFGSTMTYGQRYQTKLVFNIVIGGEDTDGNGATLTKEQIAELDQKIIETGTPKGDFLHFWKVKSLEDIPQFNFPIISEMLENRKKRIDPRGNLSSVDTKLRDKYVGTIADILNQDKDELDIARDLQDVASELNKQQELYITVLDELAAKKIISKANFKKFTAMLVDRAGVDWVRK